MPKIQKSALTVLSIASIVSVALILHRVLDPDRGCVRWDGLSEVRFESQMVGPCASMNRLRRPKLAEPMRDWIRRLNRLNRLSWLIDSPRSVRLTIDDRHPFAFEAKDREIRIGFVLADKPGQLERAVLLGWVGRNWPDHEPLVREVMADLLTWSVTGDANWSDPTKPETVSMKERLKFSLIPQSKENYCRFPFRSLEDLISCQESSGSIDPQMSLRPLISWTIWNFVRQLPTSKQIRFYEALVSKHFQPAENTMDPEHLQAWTQKITIELLRGWTMSDASDLKNLRTIFGQEELNEPVSFDLTVEVTDPALADRTLKSLKTWMKFSPPKRVLFVSGEKKLILPDSVPTDIESKDLNTHRFVILACDWPKSNAMTSLKAPLLYALKVCGDQRLPSWRDLIASENQSSSRM